MGSSVERLPGRTAEEWFNDAVRWYLEGHQGCPCCQAHHCVFRSVWGLRIEYHCTACDFSVARDGQSLRCTASRGEGKPSARLKLGRDSAFELPAPLSRG
jgi:hypothetical protein